MDKKNVFELISLIKKEKWIKKKLGIIFNPFYNMKKKENRIKHVKKTRIMIYQNKEIFKNCFVIDFNLKFLSKILFAQIENNFYFGNLFQKSTFCFPTLIFKKDMVFLLNFNLGNSLEKFGIYFGFLFLAFFFGFLENWLYKFFFYLNVFRYNLESSDQLSSKVYFLEEFKKYEENVLDLFSILSKNGNCLFVVRNKIFFFSKNFTPRYYLLRRIMGISEASFFFGWILLELEKKLFFFQKKANRDNLSNELFFFFWKGMEKNMYHGDIWYKIFFQEYRYRFLLKLKNAFFLSMVKKKKFFYEFVQEKFYCSPTNHKLQWMTVYAQTLSKLSVSPWIRFPFKYRNEFSRANDNLKKEWQILKAVQREGGSLPKKYKKNTFPTHKTTFFEVKPPIFRTKKKNFLFFLIYFRSPKKKKKKGFL